jgi:sec-independent protein translocase protein TatB
MSLSHMVILGIIALIVIPPEKLPELARQIAKFIYELKNSAEQIMVELKKDAVFKPEDIIDKNIKEKLAELQNDLNQTVSLQNTSSSNNSVEKSVDAPAQTIQPTKTEVKKNE